ncbi:hypothetical protein [Candidatus Uabimicrobium amorphum]|uniref:Uncharacterized protein n=1 Tax=Uabimicrobium amorphum TaxID=2596890 RepID=A0A5S9IMK7_UABAM|nr:hypothetical protein [Candidatus Uabimicrobium amorphum]BBM84678.1 hypothetical protein UABAM_03039 [Candidatus Uabimicrobium amorphum]
MDDEIINYFSKNQTKQNAAYLLHLAKWDSKNIAHCLNIQESTVRGYVSRVSDMFYIKFSKGIGYNE